MRVYLWTQLNHAAMTKSNLIEMNNMGIVVASLDKAISFFEEIGLQLERRTMVEGEWAGRVTGSWRSES